MLNEMYLYQSNVVYQSVRTHIKPWKEVFNILNLLVLENKQSTISNVDRLMEEAKELVSCYHEVSYYYGFIRLHLHPTILLSDAVETSSGLCYFSWSRWTWKYEVCHKPSVQSLRID